MLVKSDRYLKNNYLCIFRSVVLWFTLCSLVVNMAGCATMAAKKSVEQEIALLDSWSGDFPVSELGRLPDGQQSRPLGFIGDTETFIPIWRVFMPDKILPAIDFSKNIVVFTRNTLFYNRTSILKITLHDSIAEIIAMETMSAIPIEEKVAMAIAVIPRDGILAIQAGAEKIDVIPNR